MRKYLTFLTVICAAVAFAQQQTGNSNLRERLNRFQRPRSFGRGAQLGGDRAMSLGGDRGATSLSTAPSLASPAASSAADASVSGKITFNGAPLEMVFKIYGDLVNKTILKDPQLPNAQITLIPKEGQELTDPEKILAIETVLEMNGVHMEPYGEKFVRALPRKDVRKEGIPLIMDPDYELGDTGRVVSMMITFKNISTEEAQKVLEGLKSNTAVLLVFERTNSILVTDTEQNIKRMLEIARTVDVSTPVTEQVFVRQIKNASAAEIKTALEAIVQDSKQEQEKAGGNKNHPAPQQPQRPMFPNRPGLLSRNNNQPQQPVNAESLVMSVSDADRGTIRGKVLILSDERSNKLIIVTSQPNMDFFDKVIEQLDVETTPDTVVKVYRLKYANAEDVSDMINDLIGNAASSKGTSKGNQNQNAKAGGGANMTRNTGAKQPANKRTGAPSAGELSKENTTVLADKRINGLVVMTNKELVPVIEQIIEAMDIKLSQVLIETVIIEVTLGDDLKTGIDWVRLGNKRYDTTKKLGEITEKRNLTDEWGRQLYWTDETRADTGINPKDEDGNILTPAWEYVTRPIYDTTRGLWNGDSASQYMLGGGGGDKTATGLLNSMLNVAGGSSPDSSGGDSESGTGGSGAASAAAEVVSSLSPAGPGLNWFLKADKFNLGAIIQASKMDSRAKYIASPIVMTVDNKEATIEATESRKFYSGSTSSANYSTSVSYNYSDKDIGIKIKVTPKINPNGTVLLEVEEEYSQLGAGQKVLVSGSGTGAPAKEDVDTALSRKMTADVLLENRQTVVLGGLTETFNKETESGIPILKDIPWIGRWLFGSVSEIEERKELLVFMTPYVLAEGDDAEAEALRRKQALSDPNAWDDHGWSKSKLADPVKAKERLRKQKLEWKNIDSDHDAERKLEKLRRNRMLDMDERELSEKQQDEEFEKDLQERKEEIEASKREYELRKARKAAEAEAAAAADAAKSEAKPAKPEAPPPAKPAEAPAKAAESRAEATPESGTGLLEELKEESEKK